MADAETIHAGCVAVAEGGVLITGPSGSGKSTLARELIEAARREGIFARLVSDDRTQLQRRHDRLVARPVAAIRGLLEIRGVGLVHAPVEDAVVVRLVVELSEEAPRLPEQQDATVLVCNVALPRFFSLKGAPLASIVLDRLRRRSDTVVTLR